MPPLRLFVDGFIGERPQSADGAPIHADSGGRYSGARRLIHKGHELVGESRHGAADTDSADVRTPAHTIHPSPFGNVAIDYRAPAAHLDNSFGRVVTLGEISL